MSDRNMMELRFLARSENESFARVTVAAFISQLDPIMEELTEIKTVVSEAVTNSIIHGYEGKVDGTIYVKTELNYNEITLIIQDEGKGIENLEQARQPLYTTKPEIERSGMGFTIMENFMDSVDITTGKGKGTTIKLVKKLRTNEALCN